MADNVSFIGGSRPYRFRVESKVADAETGKKRTRRTPNPVRIAILASQQLVRDVLTQWLNRIGGNPLVSAFASAEELAAEWQADGRPLDLLVVGCAALGVEQVCAAVPKPEVLANGTPVVVVADNEEKELVERLIRLGVRGYIPTGLEPEVADAALRLVLAGGIYVPASAMTPGPRQSQPAPAAPPPPPDAAEAQRQIGLTARESDVLNALKAGMSNRAISEALGISESTVMVHIRNLMRKVGATNRTEAVYKAMRRIDGE